MLRQPYAVPLLAVACKALVLHAARESLKSSKVLLVVPLCQDPPPLHPIPKVGCRPWGDQMLECLVLWDADRTAGRLRARRPRPTCIPQERKCEMHHRGYALPHNQDTST